MMIRARVFVFAGACAMVSGCDRKSEPPPAGIPPLPGSPPPGRSSELAHPPTGHPGLPTGHPPIDQPIVGEMPQKIDPGAPLAGKLLLADAVKDHVAKGDVIFLVARQDDGSEKGSIVAVRKLTAGDWPQPFQLDGRDAMSAGTKFEGKLVVTARVDKDGDAISKQPGDVLGVTHTEAGRSNVQLVLDTVAK